MSYKEILQEMNQLLILAKKAKNIEELKAYYLKYLKLSMHLNSLPLFEEGLNCYAYAMSFSYPPIFRDMFYYLEGKSFPFYVGFVGNPLLVNTTEPKKMLENFHLDCEELGLEVYSSSLGEPIKHDNGEKIAFYINSVVDEDGDRDFHFMRQSSDGVWHHKDGLISKASIPTEVEEVLFSTYQLGEVVEIVKPFSRRKSR